MFALWRTSSITDGIVKCLRIDPFEERMKIVRNVKRRSNCFKVTHFASGCMQKSGCYIEGCTGKHMTVFHPPERYLQTRRSNGTNNDDVKEASPNNQSNVRDASDHTSPNHAIGAGVCKPGSTSNASAVWRKVRLRVVTVRVQGKQPGQVVETYALVSNGSDVSLCDKRLIQEWGFSGIRGNFYLTTQERWNSARTGFEVNLIVNSLDSGSSLEVPKVWTVERLNISEQSIPADRDVNRWPHLNRIEILELKSQKLRTRGEGGPITHWMQRTWSFLGSRRETW